MRQGPQEEAEMVSVVEGIIHSLSVLIVDLESRAQSSRFKLVWTRRLSKLTTEEASQLTRVARETFSRLFEIECDGVRFVTASNQEESHDRLYCSVESLIEEAGLVAVGRDAVCYSSVIGDSLQSNLCMLGKFCARAPMLGARLVGLLGAALEQIGLSEYEKAMEIIAFVRATLGEGMIPLGIERSEEGCLLHLFVCT